MYSEGCGTNGMLCDQSFWYMQVTSSSDAASTHEGYAQGISSGLHGSDRPEAFRGTVSAMMPYEACFSDAPLATSVRSAADKSLLLFPACMHVTSGGATLTTSTTDSQQTSPR